MAELLIEEEGVELEDPELLAELDAAMEEVERRRRNGRLRVSPTTSQRNVAQRLIATSRIILVLWHASRRPPRL